MLYGKHISIIFASPPYAREGRLVIGKGGNIPWKGMIPSDMKRFALLTTGWSVVMGRKTWDSLDFKFRPLPGRHNIVLTRNLDFKIEDSAVSIVHSFEEAIRLAQSKLVWVIGGAEIYALAIPVADHLHWTIIYERFDGDTFFPNYNAGEWKNDFAIPCEAGGIDSPKDKFETRYLFFKRNK